MAEVSFQLGASADISTSSEVSDAANGVKSHFDRRFRASGRVATRIILANQVSSAVPFGGGTAHILSAAGSDTPSMGRYWSVRSIALFNVADPTAVTALSDTGVALLAVGNTTNPTPADINACVPDKPNVMTSGQLFFTPFADTFNVGSVIVPHGQTPYLVLPPTFYTSVPISCQFRVEEYMEQSFLETHL